MFYGNEHSTWLPLRLSITSGSITRRSRIFNRVQIMRSDARHLTMLLLQFAELQTIANSRLPIGFLPTEFNEG